MTERNYENWMTELRRLATEQEVAWLVCPTSVHHRESFDRGSSPQEELNALKDMSEWRGCGCGGSA